MPKGVMVMHHLFLKYSHLSAAFLGLNPDI